MKFLPRRVLKNWLHWQIAYRGFHFGFHAYGNCWKWKIEREDFGNCTHWGFWRFFFACDKKP